MANKGSIFLWTAILIYAAGSSIIAKMVQLGNQHLVDGRNPISFCNVLFAGNLVAGITLLLLFRKVWHPHKLTQISKKQWLTQIGIAALSGAVAPSLMFTALAKTSVTNVVLIETIEIPLTLFLAWLIANELANRWTIGGAILALVGVILTILLQQNFGATDEPKASPHLGGIFYALAGTCIAVFASTLSRKALKTVPLGIFSVVRNIVGCITFAIIVLVLFGAEHFADIFSPFLWKVTLVYGALIVVGGQICWFMGIRSCAASQISLASAFSPIAGIFFAWLILSELPMSAQIIGGIVILLGITVGLRGEFIDKKPAEPEQPKPNQPDFFTGV